MMKVFETRVRCVTLSCKWGGISGPCTEEGAGTGEKPIGGGDTMARDINYFFGIGNLTREPDLRYTPQGTAICRFGIAMNRQYQGRDGAVEDTTFINIAAWSKVGENCARFLHKGSRVAVVGELRSNSWEDQEGNKRTSYEINAINVQFLSPPRSRGEDEHVSDSSESYRAGTEKENYTFQGQPGDEDNALGDLEEIPSDEQKKDDISPF